MADALARDITSKLAPLVEKMQSMSVRSGIVHQFQCVTLALPQSTED